MPNLIPASLIERRIAALSVYSDLHSSDGVTPAAWIRCAEELEDVATELAIAGCTANALRYVQDRAVDSGHEAVACARRLAAAISQYTGLQAIEGHRAVRS